MEYRQALRLSNQSHGSGSRILQGMEPETCARLTTRRPLFRAMAILLFLPTLLLSACGAGDPTSSSPAPGVGGERDTTSPVVTISSPTTSSTYTTSSSTLSLAGSATDNAAVTQVSWTNSAGGSGTASGTSAWSISSIALQAGTNLLTVTARDAAGNTATDTLTVTFNLTDTTPPVVLTTSPVNAATNISTGVAITATFNEAMSAASINTGTFTVSGVSGNVTTTGVTATFTPSSALASSTTYTATLVGGASGVKDLAGNALVSSFTWSFTTSAPLACGSANILCVDDTAGATQEYATIQAAVDVAAAGDTVLVYDGVYRGFVASRSGTSSNRIVIKANGSSALINSTNSRNEGITLSRASYVTVEGFTITGMPGYGLATHDASSTTPMRGLIVRNNTVQNSGSSNIYLSQVADSIIEGNTASGSVASHGIYLANGGSDNTVLRANRCHNNGKNGIHFNGDIREGGDGLHSGITVENNILYNNTDNGVDADGVQDSVFRNNLMYGNGRNALRLFQIDSAQGPKNIKVMNNTLLVPAGGGWAIKFTQDLGGHTFFNNILLSDNSSTGSISMPNTNFVSNYNALVGRLSLNSEATIVSLAVWQAAGFDANSFTTTPSALFVSTVTPDYRLKSGAPAINTGSPSLNGILAPLVDILGAVRPQGIAHDLGAYESF